MDQILKFMYSDKTIIKAAKIPTANYLEILATKITSASQRYFPDPYIFATLAVVIISLSAISIGVTPRVVAIAFGDGFWSLIPFTMQMAFMTISGYMVALSPPGAAFVCWLAKFPKNGRTAVAYIAFISLILSLLNWAISLVLSGLLVRALAARSELHMDYRAAGAAAYLGLGSIWAMGLSSSAALLQANSDSLPKNLLDITGVIPFTQTIFLWQSQVLVLILIIISVFISYYSAPNKTSARTAASMAIIIESQENTYKHKSLSATRPGEWLECSPILTIFLALICSIWLFNEFMSKGVILAISNLNTYNFLFLTLGLLLNWQPKRFLLRAQEALPATFGIFMQFPLYGGVAYILTKAIDVDGYTLSHYIANGFISIAWADIFPIVIGAYSAILGFFVPSGGGKWIIEAPYIMQAAKDLGVHMGWTVQIYNAAEALPNLINPFWMLPLLGVLGLKAKDIVGFTFIQFLIHTPVVLIGLWLLAKTF